MPDIVPSSSDAAGQSHQDSPIEMGEGSHIARLLREDGAIQFGKWSELRDHDLFALPAVETETAREANEMYHW